MSCSSSKDISHEHSNSNSNSNFKIVNTPLVIENDTIYINELRFYKIQSAMDGMKLMYQNYGKWNKKIIGKHQNNINKIIWENIQLIDGNDERFTVIADGTETISEYFACLMVFDSKEKDCFSAEHPYKSRLTNLFAKKMSGMDKNSSVYTLFK
jgi:hypothetical protein